jgi:hypothetical protein
MKNSNTRIPAKLGSIKIAFLAIITLFLLQGCAVPFPVYTVSSENITTIRSTPRTITLGEFEGEQKSVSCRLQPIEPDNGKTFAKYIHDAFLDELIIANAAANSGLKITAKVLNVDVDCAMGTASWEISMEVTVGNQPPFVVDTVRGFDGNFIGAVVVTRAYQAFTPTVRDVITNILNHPSFKKASNQ